MHRTRADELTRDETQASHILSGGQRSGGHTDQDRRDEAQARFILEAGRSDRKDGSDV